MEAEAFLKEKDHQKFLAQYFWQEKADLEKSLGNLKESNKALEKLETLKQEPGFNQAD